MVNCVVCWKLEFVRFGELFRIWGEDFLKARSENLSILYVNDLKLLDMRFVFFILTVIIIHKPAGRLDNVFTLQGPLARVLMLQLTDDDLYSRSTLRPLHYYAIFFFKILPTNLLNCPSMKRQVLQILIFSLSRHYKITAFVKVSNHARLDWQEFAFCIGHGVYL